MNQYQNVLQHAQQSIQEGLLLSEQCIQAIAEAAPGELKNRILKITERKGKRIRSTLLFLLAHTGQNPVAESRIAQAAASIEMLHLASLLHDDVIDTTELRRGEPTAHALWGNQMAILVGDYTLAKALELVVSDDDRRIPLIVSQAASKLVAGEVLELDKTGLELNQSQYFEVIDGKTAALIEAAAAVGAILAGHPQDLVNELSQMGAQFGIAFQIIDDLLDFGFGAADLGKAKFSDLINGVMTLPLILYMDQANSEEKSQMRELRKQAEENLEARSQIIKLLTQKNAFLNTQKIAMDLIYKSLKTLEKLPDGEGKTHLLAMCGSMVGRSS